MDSSLTICSILPISPSDLLFHSQVSIMSLKSDSLMKMNESVTLPGKLFKVIQSGECILFETGSHSVALDGLELPISISLTLSTQSSF